MHIAVVLPHTKLFGGVKRYFELGNRFVAGGHGFTVLTPQGTAPDWFDFAGSVKPLSRLDGLSLDAVFTSEEEYLRDILGCNAGMKIFYVISRNKALRDIARHKEVVFFANSTTTFERVVKKTGITPVKAFGGVTTAESCRHLPVHDDQGINILTYGRQRSKLKGTHIVVAACERLYKKGLNIKLLLFDSPVDEDAERLAREFTASVPCEFIMNHPVARNIELYRRADIFASAERKGGWSNTCAEAMASGVPVVATSVGTKDFLVHEKTGLVVRRNVFSVCRALKRLVESEALRKTFAQNGVQAIQRYDWGILAENILTSISDYLASVQH